MRWLVLVLCILSWVCAEPLLAVPPLVIEPDSVFQKVDLLPHVSYVVDTTDTQGTGQLQDWNAAFMPVTGRGVFIFNRDVYWLKLEIENRTSENRALTLVPAQTYLDSVDFYEWRDDNAVLLMSKGDRVADPDREFRFALFPLTVGPGTHTYYARIKTDGPMNLQFYAWDYGLLNKHMRRDFLFAGLLFGFIAVMIAYNSFLAIRLRILSYLAYVGYIICFGIVQFVFTGMARFLLPDHALSTFCIHSGIIFGAEIAGICGCLFAVPFLDLKKSAPNLVKLIYATFLLSATNMLISMFNFNLASSLVLFTNATISILLVYAGVTGCLRRYRPAYFYTAAWGFIIIGSLITMARIYGLLPDNDFTAWSQFVGGAIEVVLLSLALGDKISFEQEASHREISQLNSELNRANSSLKEHIENVEAIVEEKTRDIRSIMEHIPLGVFMIKADRTIHKDHSRHIEDIFKGHKLETRPAIEMIFEGSSLSADEMSQADSCIMASLGEDPMNFQFNSHALPLEIKRVNNRDQEQAFELTWNAIENAARVVDRILVTMRDVTEIRALQEQSRDQQQELEFIGEILSVPAARFTRFMNSCRELLMENAKLLESQGIKKRNLEILKLLFINMHTVKGAARSLYLKKMAHIFHDIEQYYALLQKTPATPWDVEKMSRDLQEAQRIVQIYERLAKEKLGRGLDPTQVIEFRTEQIETVYRSLNEAVRGRNLPEDLKSSFGDVHALFFHKIFKDVREVFDELSGCLPLLAKDLHKEIPEVALEADGILVGERGEELFRNIFVHILRNSMDHGIELPHERMDKGKSPKGRLDIVMERRDRSLLLRYSDDGRGLDLPRIAEIGLARQILPIESAADPNAVALLIFDAGLSTANQLTEISGRGVGMGAVRRFIEDCGGRITIELDSANTRDGLGCCPFHFIIELPFDLFEESLCLDSKKAGAEVLRGSRGA